jgi:SAM-dependent methyltransferase
MDLSRLNEEGRLLWNQKAAFWDALHGDDGNRFHRTLVGPAVEALLGPCSDESVLDIACGSGVMARRLASLGARVTAVDFSEELLARARAREHAGEPIRYCLGDATDEAGLAALGEGSFDAVVCTMALMDLPVIAPLYRSARRLLKSAGRLVVVTAHPAFNSNNPIFFAELSDEGGTLRRRSGIKLESYLDVPPVKAVGAPGEPNSHYYYHRPLHELLSEAFDAGLVLDGLVERSFPASTDDKPPLGWSAVPQIPAVLGMRLRTRS